MDDNQHEPEDDFADSSSWLPPFDLLNGIPLKNYSITEVYPDGTTHTVFATYDSC